MSLPRFAYLSAHVLLCAALAQACTYPKVLGDAPPDGESSSGTDSTGAPTPSTGDEPPGLVCDNPNYTCETPWNCDSVECGAPGSPFDADGCLRKTCTDSPCDADEICYSVEQASECSVEISGCTYDPQTDVCACEYTDACTTRHCIPADEGPPVECPQITDETACLAAGCSEFHTLTYWRLDENNQCVIDDEAPTCLWFPGDAWGGAESPAPFYEKATGRVVYFGTDWLVPPHGWGDCDDPDAPPACECVGMCSDLQAQADLFREQDKPCNDDSDCANAEAICYYRDTCGSLGVHKDNLDAWNALHAQLDASNCCDGAALCAAGVICENNRCVAKFGL
ncbi:hypothetical protein [Nannocystis punicea]|uniref:Uncharacterized protein n=1 Tax=Nannocystis punicea TaxID=2995304 RepID=A0ABY7HJV0_9BACT|nr:hypothetical protein [Nannocystis poenicansa]WAS99214.1 hypothetical protein O0S08_24055 [Nannocystis poenicansa]